MLPARGVCGPYRLHSADRPGLHTVYRSPEFGVQIAQHATEHCGLPDFRQRQIRDHEPNPGTTKMPQHDAVRAQLEEQLSRLLKRVGKIEAI